MTIQSGFFHTAEELERNGVPFVIVTLTGVRGHAPQDVGAKALMTAQGLAFGTVGGGKVEAKCIATSKELLAKLPAPVDPLLVTWNLQRDVGMTCGGEVTYLFETHHRESWHIVVLGAGHVGQAVVRALERLECRVTCIDPRPEWIERLPRSPKIHPVLAEKPEEYLVAAKARGEVSSKTFFAIMTKGHATDMPVLFTLFREFPDAAYLGVIGSDVKALKIRAELKASGIAESQVANLHSPIGLPIGSNDPEEIAISIVAELLQVRGRGPKA